MSLIASDKKIDRSSISKSPSRKVLLYNSGSVSRVFFTHKNDDLSLSYNKKSYKELLEAAASSQKKPSLMLENCIND
jgi:hypothetical protein